MKTPVLSTHDMHFDFIVEYLVREAYENEKQNRAHGRKTKGTGKNKKSPIQNGAASAACLLMFINMESAIRRKFYSLSEANRASAYSNTVLARYKVINDKSRNLELTSEYLKELELLRDIIAHAYLFEGEIGSDDDHNLTSITEKAIGGREKERAIKRLTPLLRLHIAPNQMSFKDIAVYRFAILFILTDAKLSTPYELWNWGKDEDLEPEEWLIKAMKSLHYGNTAIWLELQRLLDDAKYADFLIGIEGLGQMISSEKTPA